jgi:hypothetical protein
MVLKYQTINLYSNRHTVWKDSYNEEYLKYDEGTKEWIWIASYLHQYYEVEINLEKIFKKLKDAYYFKKEIGNRGLCNKAEEALSYFKSYVERLKTETK